MKSYLKFLSRNKLYTAVEAVGLVVSLAFVIIIGSYVWQQYAIAHSTPDGERVYAVSADNYFFGLSWWDKACFEEEIPEVETACRIGSTDEDAIVTYKGEPFNAIVTYGDPELFEIFSDHPVVDGSLEPYRLKGQCLVSESFAKRVLGENPVGKQISMRFFFENVGEYTVCGVYRDFTNSMMPTTEVLLNPEFEPTHVGNVPFSSVGNFTTLLKVHEGTDRELFAQKIKAVCHKNYDRIGLVKDFLIHTLPEVYFNDNQFHFKSGSRQVLRVLSVVVLLLFVSALFNYINLNMALSGKRAKEMATRRLLGTQKSRIIFNYMVESVLFTAVCFVGALLLAYALLPMMNNLLGISGDDGFHAWQFAAIRIGMSAACLATYLLVIVLAGCLAGLAPAAMASRFAPIDVVRGRYRLRSKMLFSKVFIVFQNVITVVMIALALLMEVQMRYMLNRPLNARSEGLYSLQFFTQSYTEMQPLIDRLEMIPEVESVGCGRGFAGQIQQLFGFPDMEGEEISVWSILCDDVYFNQLGLHVIEDFGHPKPNSVWFSKSLADKLLLNDSSMSYYSQRFNFNGAKVECVGGVYEDIPTSVSSANEEQSLIVVAPRKDIAFAEGLVIEVSGNYKEAEAAVMNAYEEYSAEENSFVVPPARNGYVRDLLDRSLLPAQKAMRLLELFMLLSVLISLLGLVAMSTYYSGENTKSIAVRKTFGSDVRRELWRSVRSYMLLVGIAAMIGVPVAVWLSGKYLERFAYRIEHYGWVFAVAVLLTALMAFLSVLWQTLRAAKTNPAEALKKE